MTEKSFFIKEMMLMMALRDVGCIWSSWDNIGRIGRSSK